MAKLRFDNLSLNQFSSFKLIPKKRTIIHDGNKKLTPKLVRGVCIREGDDFKIQINVKALKPDIIDKGQPDLLVLDFTEESYEIKGVTSVWDRNPDKNGKYIRYLRSEAKAKFHPGSPEMYVPFCHNWVCSGYIVRRNGKMMFDFNECTYLQGYDRFISEDD
jgi:hypothetical protein